MELRLHLTLSQVLIGWKNIYPEVKQSFFSCLVCPSLFYQVSPQLYSAVSMVCVSVCKVVCRCLLLSKNAAKQTRQHARIVCHRKSSSTKGRPPPKIVFQQRSSSTEGRLPHWPPHKISWRYDETAVCLILTDVCFIPNIQCIFTNIKDISPPTH